MSPFTSGSSQTLGLAGKLLQPGLYMHLRHSLQKKDQEDGLDTVSLLCHIKVWARFTSCVFGRGGPCSSQVVDCGSDPGPSVVSWTGQDLGEDTRLQCSEGVSLPKRVKEIRKQVVRPTRSVGTGRQPAPCHLQHRGPWRGLRPSDTAFTG